MLLEALWGVLARCTDGSQVSLPATLWGSAYCRIGGFCNRACSSLSVSA